MVNMYKDVKVFQTAVGQNVSEVPEFPDENERVLRRKLLKEEVEEYFDGEDKDDIENVAKELADIIYIVCGTAASYGIPLDRVFNEVHRSNLSKLNADGSVSRREDGKILKGPNYNPPDIKSVLYGDK